MRTVGMHVKKNEDVESLAENERLKAQNAALSAELEALKAKKRAGRSQKEPENQKASEN